MTCDKENILRYAYLEELKNVYNYMFEYYYNFWDLSKSIDKEVIDILTSSKPLFNHNYVENLIKQNNEVEISMLK